MPKTGNALSVRLDENQRAEIQRLAEKFAVDSITVFRWAVSALIDYAKAHGGRILLPLNLEESFTIHQNQPTKRRILRAEMPVSATTLTEARKQLQREKASAK